MHNIHKLISNVINPQCGLVLTVAYDKAFGPNPVSVLNFSIRTIVLFLCFKAIGKIGRLLDQRNCLVMATSD